MKLECPAHPLGFQLSPLEELCITQMLGTSSVNGPFSEIVDQLFTHAGLLKWYGILLSLLDFALWIACWEFCFLGLLLVFCPSMTQSEICICILGQKFNTVCRGFPLNPIPVSGVDGQDLKVQVWVRRVSSLRTKCISVVCRWHGSFSFIST